MSKKPKKLGKKPKDFTAQIFKILSREPSKSFNYKQIAAVLELSDTKSRNEIIRDLKILKAQDKIHETEIGKYQIISKAEYYEGIVDMTSRKTGYFVCDELEDDVFIPFINLNHALDGDKVKAYIYNRRSSRKPEAEVLEITSQVAIEGSKISIQNKIPMADSLIIASARSVGAKIWTQDYDFKGLDNVMFFKK